MIVEPKIKEASEIIRKMKSLRILIKKHVVVNGEEYWFHNSSTTRGREQFLAIHEALQYKGPFFRKEEDGNEFINTFALSTNKNGDEIKITFTTYTNYENNKHNSYEKFVITTFAKVVDANVEKDENGVLKSVELVLDSGFAIDLNIDIPWKNLNISSAGINRNVGPFLIAKFE